MSCYFMLFHELSVFRAKMTINSVFPNEIASTNIENLLLLTPNFRISFAKNKLITIAYLK